MRAEKRSGAYRVQVQKDGKRYSFTAKKKSDAIRQAEEFLKRKADVTETPLGDAINEYIAMKENVLSPSTIRGYKKVRRNNFQELMPIPVRELDSETIQRAINRMSANHSPKSVANAYGLLTATLSMYAPMMRLEVTLPSERPQEYNVPTKEDVDKLLTAASPNMKTAIMLAAYCSLRRGEIVALDSSDINGNVIHVKQAAVQGPDGKITIKSTKTYKSDRYVTMPDKLVKIVEGKTGRICPIALSTITKEFRRIRKKAGVNCRFHDLRHYYASALHAIGVPDQYVMKSGGWKNPAMLHKVYRNTLSDFEKINTDKAVNYFDDKIDQSAPEMHQDTR